MNVNESYEFVDEVIKSKYCHDGENSWEDIVNRFRDNLPDDSVIPDRMLEKKFIPAGSVLYGFGINDKNLSMSNCYFIPIEEDSIEGIFEFGKKQCRTYSYRGGVGTDISILRPEKTPVNNAARTSTGSISFMPVLSTNTGTIGQSGRRGAFMLSEQDWHPDIFKFAKSKTSPEEVFEKDELNDYLPNIYYANISVKLSDEFFKAVKNNSTWDLKFPDIEADKDYYNKNWTGDLSEWNGKVKIYETVKAVDLLKTIAKAAWTGAEPGVLYWDTVLRATPLGNLPKYKPKGVNPCGEEPLGDYQNCNLHAIVLYKYIKNPYTSTAYFDYNALMEDLPHYLAFGDLIIDKNNHPLPEQNEMDKYLRKVGLEFTGVADTLAMLNLDYGEENSLKFLEDLFSGINAILIEANIELAIQRGKAPVFEDNNNLIDFIESEFIQRLPAKLIEQIKRYGLRNSAWTTIGPTGSVSIVANNCSSGIEPVFRLKYKRYSRLLNKETELVHLPLMEYLINNKPEDLDLSADELKAKYHYKEAHEIDWLKRLKLQSVVQKYITDSISSTINLPESATPEDIYNIYLKGWELGLKGVTVFRNNSITGVLRDDEDKIEYTPNLIKKDLLTEEKAKRYIVKWEGVKVYINVVYDELDGKPLEIYAQLPIEAGYDVNGIFKQDIYLEKLSYWHTISRLLSLIFRYDLPIDEVQKQLKKSSYSMVHLPAIISRVLAKYPLETPFEDDLAPDTQYAKCPSCGEMQLIKEAGCEKCLSCGYSKCG